MKPLTPLLTTLLLASCGVNPKCEQFAAALRSVPRDSEGYLPSKTVYEATGISEGSISFSGFALGVWTAALECGCQLELVHRGGPVIPEGKALNRILFDVNWKQTPPKQLESVQMTDKRNRVIFRVTAAHVLEDEIEARNGAQTAYDNLMAEREKGLRDKWGVAYPQKLQVAKTVVAALGYDPKDPELFGNPKVLEFLGNVTGMLSEDAVASMRGVVGNSGTFSSPAEEARAITRDPKHPDHEAYMKGDQAIVAKVRRPYDSA